MAETPWSKIHGRNPPWSRFDLLSLSKPRWSPWFDVSSSWLCFGVFYWWGLALSFGIFGILFFIWLCFGFFFVLLLLFWLSVLGFVSWLCYSIWVWSWFCICFCFMVLFMFLLVWMLRKCKKREENLEFLIFWATMFLGEEQLLFK